MYRDKREVILKNHVCVQIVIYHISNPIIKSKFFEVFCDFRGNQPLGKVCERQRSTKHYGIFVSMTFRRYGVTRLQEVKPNVASFEYRGFWVAAITWQPLLRYTSRVKLVSKNADEIRLDWQILLPKAKRRENV